MLAGQRIALVRCANLLDFYSTDTLTSLQLMLLLLAISKDKENKHFGTTSNRFQRGQSFPMLAFQRSFVKSNLNVLSSIFCEVKDCFRNATDDAPLF